MDNFDKLYIHILIENYLTLHDINSWDISTGEIPKNIARSCLKCYKLIERVEVLTVVILFSPLDNVTIHTSIFYFTDQQNMEMLTDISSKYRQFISWIS